MMVRVISKRATRRRFIKAASATAGAVIAAGYTKPELQSFGIPTALALSGDSSGINANASIDTPLGAVEADASVDTSGSIDASVSGETK